MIGKTILQPKFMILTGFFAPGVFQEKAHTEHLVQLTNTTNYHSAVTQIFHSFSANSSHKTQKSGSHYE